jgi:hypothetical protein
MEAIQERLAIYHRHIQESMQFYKMHHIPIVNLDACQTPEKMFEDFKKVVVGIAS